MPHEDAIHAILNAIYTESEFEDSRIPDGIRPTLFIGPQRKLAAPLLEVMAEVEPPETFRVFHVMNARKKHLDRIGGTLDGD